MKSEKISIDYETSSIKSMKFYFFNIIVDLIFQNSRIFRVGVSLIHYRKI
jgi:hypothetical protein